MFTRVAAQAVGRTMDGLRKLVPNAGSYEFGSDPFEANRQ
jgi:hypothetical protein